MEDVQSLLEKINREGVEKANAEAEKIIAAATAKADAILKSAREESAQMRASAEQEATASAARAAETIRQAARDTILKVEASVTALLEKILVREVERSLADEGTVRSLVTEAIKGLTGEVEVTLPAALAPALKAALAAQTNVTVVMDEALDTGFSVKTDGGRVEHAFTPDVIANELSKRLRPDLAKLLK